MDDADILATVNTPAKAASLSAIVRYLNGLRCISRDMAGGAQSAPAALCVKTVLISACPP